MKTIYINPNDWKIVDNEHDYDFVGWIENFSSSTLVIVFEEGELVYDKETDEDYFDEEDWEIDSSMLPLHQHKRRL